MAVRRASDNALIATCTYDLFDRRIRKTTTAIATIVGMIDVGYVYDGWNVAAEYTIGSGPSIALKQGNIWGLDLSGSMQGADGVGGLLGVLRTPGLDGSGNRTWRTAYHLTYDGNGNVSEYLDSGSSPAGSSVTHYEYDPFGHLSGSGTVPDLPYSFSTKPFDWEMGMYYYGYRYYNSRLGSWLLRDPIQEKGGRNLYEFIGNEGVSHFGFLGLQLIGEKELFEVESENGPLEEYLQKVAERLEDEIREERVKAEECEGDRLEDEDTPESRALAAKLKRIRGPNMWPEGTDVDAAIARMEREEENEYILARAARMDREQQEAPERRERQEERDSFNEGVDLYLKYMPHRTKEQRQAADEKAEVLSKADTVVTPRPTQGGSGWIRTIFRTCSLVAKMQWEICPRLTLV